MASVKEWVRKVFRLRYIPNRISNLDDAASLLGDALGIPAGHVIVYSIAPTLERVISPSKEATLQLKSVPGRLQQTMTNDEWLIPIPGARAPGEVMILDTHFRDMTVLSDVDKAHVAEYAITSIDT